MSRSDSVWTYDEDRCYHGIDPKKGPARIYVELCEFGPTERTRTVVLRELRPDLRGEDFGWGHIGGGPGRAARAILSDALGLEVPWGIAGDFNADFLAMCPDEFWIRRSVVLRWARGLLADRGATDLPDVLKVLPPVDRQEYQARPHALRWEQLERGCHTIESLL